MILCAPIGAVLIYVLWSPGRIVTDGSHDRQTNGLWLSHGWLGDDSWFTRHSQRDTLPPFRDPDYIVARVSHWRSHGIVDLFPHLAPASAAGRLPGVDAQQAERFLDATDTMRVLPWIGGVHERDIRASDAAWRAAFVQDVTQLLSDHPRLAGVHLNVEPWPDGDGDLLFLLKELRAAMPGDRLLSVAAYPPPTRWHPFPDLHWGESYFREVASRCDHLAVMMYDTALQWRKPYRKLMADWTRQVLQWSGDTPVLLGVPAYEDEGVGYHHPQVENIDNALRGIHAGLSQFPSLPDHYLGIAIYSDWTTDDAEWAELSQNYLQNEAQNK